MNVFHETTLALIALSLVILVMAIALFAYSRALARLRDGLERAAVFAGRLDAHVGHGFELENAPAALAPLGEALTRISMRLARQHVALSDSEARSGALVSASPDGLVTFDDSGTIIEFNSAAERCFGLPRATVLGRPIELLGILPPAPSDRPPLRTSQARTAGRIRPRVARMLGRRVRRDALRADGAPFSCEVTLVCTPLGDRDQYTLFVRDITHERHRERQLEDMRRSLEEAERAERELFSALGRRLRRPIGEIADQASRALHTTDPAEREVRLTSVRDGAQRLSALLDDLLDLPEDDGHVGAAAPRTSCAPFSAAVLRGQFGSDPEPVRRLSKVFGQHAAQTLKLLSHTVGEGRLPEAAFAAHTIKGALTTLGAHSASALAERLENAAGMGAGGEAQRLLGDLEDAVDDVLAVLAECVSTDRSVIP